MAPDTLQSWMQHPEMLNRDTLGELRGLLQQYPYFQSLRLLYLKNLYLLRDSSFGDELRKSVLYVADRRVLFYLIENGITSHADSHEQKTSFAVAEEPGVDRTLALIDAFLAKSQDVQPQQQPMALDYAMDYVAYLMRTDNNAESTTETEEVPKLRGQELIDGFIHESEKDGNPSVGTVGSEGSNVASQSEAVASDGDLDESYFTETLAKIYMNQHRYEKALEIIKKLSLKYPKKSAYFADQIRDVEQMIINAKSK